MPSGAACVASAVDVAAAVASVDAEASGVASIDASEEAEVSGAGVVVVVLWLREITATASSAIPAITVTTTREDEFFAGALDVVVCFAGALVVLFAAGVVEIEVTFFDPVVGTGGMTMRCGEREVVFLATFFATFLAGAFLAGAFFATFLATFLAGAFFATFLAGAFLATFLATLFAATFLAGAFFAAFLAGAFLATFFALFLTATVELLGFLDGGTH